MSRLLHFFELQKHNSTLGATLWLPDPTKTDSNSTRQVSSKGKNEGAHPLKNPTMEKLELFIKTQNTQGDGGQLSDALIWIAFLAS